jgi:phospholipase/carboxylesterase
MTDGSLGYGLEPLAGGAAGSLCVLLHGYGADGADLMGAAGILTHYFPDMYFAAPNAPEPCASDPDCFQWYSPLAGRDAADAEVATLAPRINRYIDGQLARLGVPDDRLVVLGFSQGGGVAIEAALTRARPCAALLAFTSAVRNRDTLGQRIRARPPVLLVHGTEDTVIPPASVERSAAALRAQGLVVEQHLCAGIGHTMNEEGVHVAAAFVRRHAALGGAHATPR